MRVETVGILMLAACALHAQGGAKSSTAAQTPASSKSATMQPDPAKPTTASPAAVTPEAAGPPDPVLDQAAALVGRPLILRCLCDETTLTFDRSGHLQKPAQPKLVDWTLAAMNVQTVTRKSPTEVELDGIRVIETFAQDRQEFDRRPMPHEKIAIILAVNDDPAAFKKALHEVFSIGIDRRLQLATPDYWQHYFDPNLQWPKDALSGTTPLVPGQPGGPVLTAPVEEKQETPPYTPAARELRVKGATVLRVVVDPAGMPRHIAIAQPLGSGLDESAARAMVQARFTPGSVNGAPVAVVIDVDDRFDPPPQAPAAPRPQAAAASKTPTM